MGPRKGQKDVLKLVHPGGYVEIYRKPITAAQVMWKNPRHCITRPDVFEYPWIVVKPESVLKLGRVFFIVPNHTIYNLLKARGLHNHPGQFHQHTPPIKSYAGMTPKNQHQSWCLEQQSEERTLERASPGQEHDYCITFRRQSTAQYLQDMITKYQKTYCEFKSSLLTDSRIEASLSEEDEQYQLIDEVFRDELPWKKEHQEIKPNTGVNNMLKSCLRKPDSARKSLHLKVSFVLPSKGKDRPRRIIESPTEFQCFRLT